MSDAARTTSLNSILGQGQAIATLRGAAASGRVHHAWIFAGPPGVGKRTAAEAFAALLLDPTTAPNLAGELEPAEGSHTQQLIARDAHPDLHVITKELARFSDASKIRERKLATIPKDVIDTRLLAPITRAPTMRTDSLVQKVFIVDEAELLDRSMTDARVQNSMLKTLEEPPEGSVIILVTSAEDRLLPTIRSRCQRVVFHPLSDTDMRAWMDGAGLGVSADEREWLLGFAQGSPGAATVASETGLYKWANRLEPMLSAAESGRYDANLGPTMASLIDEWAKEWVEGRENASKEAANFLAAGHMLSMLAERARRSMREAGSDRESLERALALLTVIEQTDRYIRASVQAQFATEDLASRWSLLEAGEEAPGVSAL